MANGSILDQKKFWDIVKYLIDLDRKKDFEDICNDLEINKRQLNSFINFLKEVDCQLELQSDDDKKMVIPAKNTPKINIEFSLLEWLQFQAHFPALETYENKPYHDNIREKLIQVEQKYKANDLYTPLKTIEKIYGKNHLSIVGESGDLNEIVATLEESILEKQVVAIKFEEKQFKIYPRKIVYFDGDFNLIGEGTSDNSLLNFKISKIQNVNIQKITWKQVFLDHEIDDFVSSLRSISETSLRLVLKIYSYEKFSLNLDYQFFENPCVFSNAAGEYIWAATIEPNAKIYDWLYDLGHDVEILDPKSFKLEFLNYCENKLKKLA